ncbi:hypothetical protein CEUSTIGMA_g4615.t1 [Chlamydomonas eustigma]|uniref:Radical SAM core domain-containing protein n=1 Tax=Chlamydomonas eustigma TaxID=1157962 RepID=A0A250X327_9CHLO|nr:hypothetical protein CEUSTIGMA_g4615.t1 [Chlamydomonas eustigma]|eukprot:GAX77170.1 hypothetical protein CEUSTIGMA_g4615.t1 [Chlamydomonas eustigma]
MLCNQFNLSRPRNVDVSNAASTSYSAPKLGRTGRHGRQLIWMDLSLRLKCHRQILALCATLKADTAPSISATQQNATAISATFQEPRGSIRDNTGRLMLRNLTLQELQEWLISVGERPNRAEQLFRWLYGKNAWIRDISEAKDNGFAFSKVFKEKVITSASLSGGLTLQSVRTAQDGTKKLVFALNQGEGSAMGTVETVLIPMPNKNGINSRYTACLSTQVGCAMNCQFCYTGRMGLLGNLTTAQIVEQVVEARRMLSQEASDSAGASEIPIGNIVFMGMGEPLHNYNALLAAIDILAEGLCLSRSKIIVSSVGLVPEIRSFLDTKKAKLAVSLHATTDEVRDWIVPVNRRYPIKELISLLQGYFPMSNAKQSNTSDKFVVIEYVLLRHINDTAEDAVRLSDLLKDVYCMVNLIVFNPHEGTQFKGSEEESVKTFRSILVKAGKVCTVRVSKGDDTMSACGQLGDLGSSPRLAPLLQPPEKFRKYLNSAIDPEKEVELWK